MLTARSFCPARKLVHSLYGFVSITVFVAGPVVKEISEVHTLVIAKQGEKLYPCVSVIGLIWDDVGFAVLVNVQGCYAELSVFQTDAVQLSDGIACILLIPVIERIHPIFVWRSFRGIFCLELILLCLVFVHRNLSESQIIIKTCQPISLPSGPAVQGRQQFGQILFLVGADCCLQCLVICLFLFCDLASK